MAILLIIDGADGTGKSSELELIGATLKRTGITARPLCAFQHSTTANLRQLVIDKAIPENQVVAEVIASLARAVEVVSKDKTDTVYVMDRGPISTMSEQGILSPDATADHGSIFSSFINVVRRYNVPIGILFLYANAETLTKRLGMRKTDAREQSVDIIERSEAYQEAYDYLDSSVNFGSNLNEWIFTLAHDTSNASAAVRAKRTADIHGLIGELFTVGE